MIQSSHNTELRAMPFGRKAGYSSMRSIMDHSGRTVFVSGFGDIQTAARSHHISATFAYGIHPEDIKPTTTGGGTVSESDSLMNVSVTGAGQTAQAQSHESVIYKPGYDCEAIFTAGFTSVMAGTDIIQKIGPQDSQNGYAIGLEDGQLYVERFYNGVQADKLMQADFNTDPIDGEGPTAFKILPDNINLYRIQWGYLGIYPAFFEVYGGAQKGWIPFHVLDNVNKTTILQITNPHLPITSYVSSTVAGAATIKSGSWHGGSIGGVTERKDMRPFAAEATKTIAATTEVPILSVKVEPTFNSKVNRLPLDLFLLSVAADGNKPCLFKVYKNATVIGGTYNDVSAGLSFAKVNKTATSITGGEFFTTISTSKSGSDKLMGDVGDLRIHPDESFTVTAYSAQTSDIIGALSWGEAK